jgi:hypothetical protein
MIVCGVSLIWAWLRLRKGERNVLFVAYLVGALYLAAGIQGIIYRHGDPSWLCSSCKAPSF